MRLHRREPDVEAFLRRAGLATSAACATTRLISAGSTTGLAKPHAAVDDTDPEAERLLVAELAEPDVARHWQWPFRTATPLDRLKVKRMSACVQPSLRASFSASSDQLR